MRRHQSNQRCRPRVTDVRKFEEEEEEEIEGTNQKEFDDDGMVGRRW